MSLALSHIQSQQIRANAPPHQPAIQPAPHLDSITFPLRLSQHALLQRHCIICGLRGLHHARYGTPSFSSSCSKCSLLTLCQLGTVLSAPAAEPDMGTTSVIVRRGALSDPVQTCFNGVEAKCNEICTLPPICWRPLAPPPLGVTSLTACFSTKSCQNRRRSRR